MDLAERDGDILVTPMGYHPRGWYGSRGPGIPRMLRGNEADGLPENLGALAEQDVMNVLRLVTDEFNIDDDRIYLWGHSMGGAGTYHLAAKYPHVWAALGEAAPAPSAARTSSPRSGMSLSSCCSETRTARPRSPGRAGGSPGCASSGWSTCTSRSRAGTIPGSSTRTGP